MQTKIVFSVIAAVFCITTMFAQNANIKASINKLTPSEKNAGWHLLFDGNSFTGWRGFHSDKLPAGWTVEDNCIKKIPAQGELGNAGGDIITVGQYDNFELSLEWKLSPGGNSGIKYLVSENLPSTGKSGV